MATPDKLSALVASVREAEGKMTPGPWRNDAPYVEGPDGKIVVDCEWGSPDSPTEDAAGVTLLRNSALPLRDAIEELQRENAELRKALQLALDEEEAERDHGDRGGNFSRSTLRLVRAALNQPTL